ncbi:hypothetical protein [Anaerotruncus rubiinfantis]|uniref:hypothetical protein n=1 Tax=Anaerotruncus rubiinfantis TaxID=1720200 RepID=UPI0012AC316F|nr:hypothetical protein [Anaerotruncus rubiinfantis]
MQENGMLIGADRYDVQLREPKMTKCARCGEDVPEYETVEIGKATVCRDCIADYCDGLYPEYGQLYLNENAKHYIESENIPLDSDDLYLNWWFHNLERADRLRVLQGIYLLESASVGGEALKEWEKAFVTQSDDWIDFVKEHA